MLWLDEVGSWLIYSAVFGAIILLLGGLAVWVCREPVYRIRIIHWTFVACLLVPLLQQLEMIPNYSLNLWQETHSHNRSPIIPNQTFAPSVLTSVTSYDTEVATFESPPQDDEVTVQDEAATSREAVAPVLQSKTAETNDVALFPVVIRALQIVYLALVAVLFFTWTVGFVRRRMIARYAQPANAKLLETFVAIAGPNAHNARLLVSNQVGSPVMWGVWCPTIVIPSELATEGNAHQLRWCLAHEWSHVLRRDFSTLLLANLAKFVCFYQPVYWWLRRQLMLSQDFLADAFAANYGESAEDYASFLVSLARDRSQPKLAGTLGIRDRRSNLLQRINKLVKSARPVLQREKRLPAFAIIFCALLLVGGLSVVRLSAAPLNDQPTSTANTTEKKPTKKKAAVPLDAKTKSKAKNENTKELSKPITYNGKVVDQKTGQPIAGATIKIKHQLNRDPMTGERTTLRTTTHKSDEEGNYRFTLSSEEVAEKHFYLTVEIQHPQYELRRKSNSYAFVRKNLANGDLPFFTTIELFPGKAVSAVVLQPDGTPSVNTRVLVYSKPTQKESGYHSFLYSQTDENGRFEVIVARPGDGVVWVLPEHFSPLMAYLVGDRHGDIGPLQLQNGTRLTGQVLNAKGKPVANVAVNLYRTAMNLKPYDGYLETLRISDNTGTGALTDAEGRFKLTPLPPGRYDVRVYNRVHYGYKEFGRERLKVEDVFVPFELKIREGETNDPIQIRAVPHLLVRGRLLNSQGNPEPGYKQYLTGYANGQLVWIKSTLPKDDGWFEFKVLRGIEKTEIKLNFGQDSALRWRLKPDAPLRYGKLDLGTLESDFSTLEVVRYTAPELLLKVVDENGTQLPEFKISSQYRLRPPERAPAQYNMSGDVHFIKQTDGRWRSSRLLPDQDVTISIEKAGFTTKPQSVTLKEGEVRELVFVLKKSN